MRAHLWIKGVFFSSDDAMKLELDQKRNLQQMLHDNIFTDMVIVTAGGSEHCRHGADTFDVLWSHVRVRPNLFDVVWSHPRGFTGMMKNSKALKSKKPFGAKNLI